MSDSVRVFPSLPATLTLSTSLESFTGVTFSQLIDVEMCRVIKYWPSGCLPPRILFSNYCQNASRNLCGFSPDWNHSTRIWWLGRLNVFTNLLKHSQTSFYGLFILWALIYDSAFNAGFTICLFNFSGTTTSCKPELFDNCFVTAAAEWKPLCVNL